MVGLLYYSTVLETTNIRVKQKKIGLCSCDAYRQEEKPGVPTWKQDLELQVLITAVASPRQSPAPPVLPPTVIVKCKSYHCLLIFIHLS